MKASVRSGRAMGSRLSLTLPRHCDTEADAAWSIVDDVFGRAERELTRFDGASALSRLNRAAGSSVRVPLLLARALAAAWRAFRVTGGRFDPRIVGALEAAGERAGVELPRSPTSLRPTDRWLWLDARRGLARVTAPLDLGGIGKGLALRWAGTALRRSGQRRFLIAAGGDVLASGLGPAQRPWIVGIEHPSDAARHVATLDLVDAAVATSSIAVRAWRDAAGVLRHHLIDPASLEPAPAVWSSVSVVDPDPAWAEVHSKVAFLAGPRIAAHVRRSRAWWVDGSGALHTA